jgi:hypothetical protein
MELAKPSLSLCLYFGVWQSFRIPFCATYSPFALPDLFFILLLSSGKQLVWATSTEPLPLEKPAGFSVARAIL